MVGSGPAGVAAARSLIDGGIAVDLLDFGNEIENEAMDLASRLRSGSPSAEDLEHLRPSRVAMGVRQTATKLFAAMRGRVSTLDLLGKMRLGSSYTFRDIEWGIPMDGGTVSRSLATGGLSNVWGAACYPLAEEDYGGWPVQEREMAPHYRAVARMLSVIETEDDLEAVYPIYGPKSQGLPLNPPSATVFEHWRQNREILAAWNIRFGRARLAVRAEENSDGPGCHLCGLCLYGCPYDAIYRADWSLSVLRQNRCFRYLKPLWVQSFREEGDRVLVDALDRGQGQLKRLDYDALFLAAGTLSSLRIAADSLKQHDQCVRLFDNDLYLVPFLRTKGGGSLLPLRFSLNELALRVIIWGHPIHIQFYCMNEQIIDRYRPLLDVLPGPLRRLADCLLARLLLAFVYLPGKASAQIKAKVIAGRPVGTVSLQQRRRTESPMIVRRVISTLARRRRALGLVPLGPIIRSTPTGNSGGHLVGALPMMDQPGPLQTYPDGRLYGTNRVYVVDGAALPNLPAQNSTYTIMADSHRIGKAFAVRHGRGNHVPIEIDCGLRDVNPPPDPSLSLPNRTSEELPFGRPSVSVTASTLDHHQHQYNTSYLTATYHRLVLRQAVRMARLRPEMHVLDYGCGHQQLRRGLPPGVHYTGYDIVTELSDVKDPRSAHYDLVFAIQVLMYLDGPGLRAWVECFARLTSNLVVMVPARNFLKDEVLDSVFGLKKLREDMVRSHPKEIYDQLSRRFSLDSSRNVLWMDEITRWRRRD